MSWPCIYIVYLTIGLRLNLGSDAADSSGRKYGVMIVGVQKGGTSFLRNVLRMVGGCSPDQHDFWKQEVHFFDNLNWAGSSPSSKDRSDYLSLIAHCFDNTTGAKKNLFTYETSPNSYVKPWIPRRIHDSFPEQRVALILRNPTDRAWSGFLQCIPFLSTTPSLHMMSQTCQRQDARRESIRQVFHDLVLLELAIVESCGSPSGSGSLAHDWSLAFNFNLCCRAVADKLGHFEWPGCKSYGALQPELFPSLVQLSEASTYVYTLPDGKVRTPPWGGGAFGDYCFDFVRQGLYVHHVRNWYAHMTPKNVFLITSDVLFQNTRIAMHSLVKFATASSVGADVAKQIDEVAARVRHKQAFNSNREKYGDMSSHTRKLLHDFYDPFNKQLERGFLKEVAVWGVAPSSASSVGEDNNATKPIEYDIR